MGSFSFATAGHRLPGDLKLTLLSGLIATASRRNLTDHFIAFPGRTMLLNGLESTRSLHQCYSGLYFRCSSVQPTFAASEPTDAILLKSSPGARPVGVLLSFSS